MSPIRVKPVARCGCVQGQPEECVTDHSVMVGTTYSRIDVWHASGELARTVYVHGAEYRERETS